MRTYHGGRKNNLRVPKTNQTHICHSQPLTFNPSAMSNNRTAVSRIPHVYATNPQMTNPPNRKIRIEIPGPLPSWNAILAMNHWARMKFKNTLAKSFLCALRQSASDCSMRTTSAKNTMSIFADTLESFLAMKLEKRKSKRASAKQKKGNRNPRSSKLS